MKQLEEEKADVVTALLSPEQIKERLVPQAVNAFNLPIHKVQIESETTIETDRVTKKESTMADSAVR